MKIALPVPLTPTPLSYPSIMSTIPLSVELIEGPLLAIGTILGFIDIPPNKQFGRPKLTRAFVGVGALSGSNARVPTVKLVFLDQEDAQRYLNGVGRPEDGKVSAATWVNLFKRHKGALAHYVAQSEKETPGSSPDETALLKWVQLHPSKLPIKMAPPPRPAPAPLPPSRCQINSAFLMLTRSLLTDSDSRPSLLNERRLRRPRCGADGRPRGGRVRGVPAVSPRRCGGGGGRGAGCVDVQLLGPSA